MIIQFFKDLKEAIRIVMSAKRDIDALTNEEWFQRKPSMTYKYCWYPIKCDGSNKWHWLSTLVKAEIMVIDANIGFVQAWRFYTEPDYIVLSLAA